jgi:hypothetical protein
MSGLSLHLSTRWCVAGMSGLSFHRLAGYVADMSGLRLHLTWHGWVAWTSLQNVLAGVVKDCAAEARYVPNFDGKLQLRAQWRPTTRSSLQCLRSDADDRYVRFGSLHTLECAFSLLNLWFASCRMCSCLPPTHPHINVSAVRLFWVISRSVELRTAWRFRS